MDQDALPIFLYKYQFIAVTSREENVFVLAKILN